MTVDTLGIQEFFAALSDRLKNENNLSDITYSMLKSDEVFRRFFLDFFFGEGAISLNCKIIREFQKNSSRPDFVFEDEKDTYILEVKLWDYNQHFNQYIKEFDKCKSFSFISNYLVAKEYLNKNDASVLPNWKCFTWNMFIAELEQKLEQSSPFYFLELGYIQFVKKIINLKELNSMDLTKITSLNCFFDHIEKIMHDKNFLDYNHSNFSRYSFGRHGQKGNVYPWFGIFYGSKTNNPTVAICFECRNNLTPQELFKTLNEVSIEGEKYTLEYDDYDKQWIFSLKEELFKTLCDNTKSSDEQHEILKTFFDEVCSVLNI